MGNLLGGWNHGENERLKHTKIVEWRRERVCLALTFAEIVLDDIAYFLINRADAQNALFCRQSLEPTNLIRNLSCPNHSCLLTTP